MYYSMNIVRNSFKTVFTKSAFSHVFNHNSVNKTNCRKLPYHFVKKIILLIVNSKTLLQSLVKGKYLLLKVKFLQKRIYEMVNKG